MRNRKAFGTPLAIGAAVMLAACTGARHSPPSTPPSAVRTDSLHTAIASAIGDAHCTGTVQCRAAPMGWKPCGGPRTYVVYSIATTDSTHLAELLRTYTTRDSFDVVRRALVSDCRAVTAPRVACQDGQCVSVRAD